MYGAGLTFVEWDPVRDADPEQPAVAMIVNSSELRAAGFSLKEVLPPELEHVAKGPHRRGAGRHCSSWRRFVLHHDVDNEIWSHCECYG